MRDYVAVVLLCGGSVLLHRSTRDVAVWLRVIGVLIVNKLMCISLEFCSLKEMCV